jgi:hypothetical protein
MAARAAAYCHMGGWSYSDELLLQGQSPAFIDCAVRYWILRRWNDGLEAEMNDAIVTKIMARDEKLTDAIREAFK